MARGRQVKERAWAGYTVQLEQSDDGWFYRIRPQAAGGGAVAGPAEQVPPGPFSSEEEAFEDAKARTLRYSGTGRPASDRLLKKAHLRRAALHLDLFEQPAVSELSATR